jgi:hypothetical protein
MNTEWRKIRNGDRNRISSGRTPVRHLTAAYSRFGMLSGTRDERGPVKCLACRDYFENWRTGRAHQCSDEAEYREYTGRLNIGTIPSHTKTKQTTTLNIDPMEYARTLIRLYEENEELKKEVAKLWEDMNKTTAPAPRGLTNLFRN